MEDTDMSQTWLFVLVEKREEKKKLEDVWKLKRANKC